MAPFTINTRKGKTELLERIFVKHKPEFKMFQLANNLDAFKPLHNDDENSSSDDSDGSLSKKDPKFSFNYYLHQYSAGKTNVFFFIYNPLSRGPKPSKVETPLDDSDNPFEVKSYSDPVTSLIVVEKYKMTDDKDRPATKVCEDFQVSQSMFTEEFPVRPIGVSINYDDLDLIDEVINNAINEPDNFQPSLSELTYSVDNYSTLNLEDWNILSSPPEFVGQTTNISLNYPSEIEQNKIIPEQFCDEDTSENKMDISEVIETDEQRMKKEDTPTISRLRSTEANDLRPDPKKLLEIGWKMHILSLKYGFLNEQTRVPLPYENDCLMTPETSNTFYVPPAEEITNKSTFLKVNQGLELRSSGNSSSSLEDGSINFVASPNSRHFNSPVENYVKTTRTKAGGNWRMFKVVKKAQTVISKKQKSQIRSRICRLKKKASLEANKIILDSLQKEQKSLLTVIRTTLEFILTSFDNKINLKKRNFCSTLDLLISTNLDDMVAGSGNSYVKMILTSTAKNILYDERS